MCTVQLVMSPDSLARFQVTTAIQCTLVVKTPIFFLLAVVVHCAQGEYAEWNNEQSILGHRIPRHHTLSNKPHPKQHKPKKRELKVYSKKIEQTPTTVRLPQRQASTLNPQKTQLIWLGSRQQLEKLNMVNIELVSASLSLRYCQPCATLASLSTVD